MFLQLQRKQQGDGGTKTQGQKETGVKKKRGYIETGAHIDGGT